MTNDVTRRNFLQAAGAGVAASAALSGHSAAGADSTPKLAIVGICCSLRQGKTTAASMKVCLQAAEEVAPDRVRTELIELADLSIPAGPAAGIALAPGQRDDFPSVADNLADPDVAAVIVGTPVYFSNMSSVCKAFLERCMVFHKNFGLANRVAGVLAVGGARNGGQELAIRSVQAALFSQDMILVGNGQPHPHSGAALWNHAKDDITQDESGLDTARSLGRRVAKVALATRRGFAGK